MQDIPYNKVLILVVLMFLGSVVLVGCALFGDGESTISPVHPSISTEPENSSGLSPNVLATTSRPKPGGFIVVFKNNVRDEEAVTRELINTHGLKIGHTYQFALNGFSATVPPGKLDALRGDSRVASVEPDEEVFKFVQILPWGIDRIDADVSPTAKAGDGIGAVGGVRIFVIDTGIQIGHPDLNRVGGIDFTGINGNGDDGEGHGTHVAGIAAAADNSSFVVGVAPGAELFAVKVLNDSGSGYLSDVIKGVDFVTEQKIANPGFPMVANMSLGLRSPKFNSLDLAVQNSIAAGVFYSIAAGNSGTDAKGFSPAHVAEAVTVAAYNENNQLTAWSNTGSLIDIVAPGNNILSTYKGSSTTTMSGTSMAAPHAAGAAALLLSNSPGLSPQQVRDQIVADGKAWIKVKKGTTNKSLYVGSY